METQDYSGQAFVYRFTWLVGPIRDAPVLPLEVRSVLRMNANETSTPSGTWRTRSWRLLASLLWRRRRLRSNGLGLLDYVAVW